MEIPFTLEAFKKHGVAKARDGNLAKFVVHVPEAREDNRVVVLNELSNIRTHSENGHYLLLSDSANDLVSVIVKTKTVWVNLYRNQRAVWHESEEVAKESVGIGDQTIAVAIPVEIPDV